VLALCFGAFLCFGMVLVLIGANQPGLEAELGLDLAGSGLLVSALSAGLGVGVVAAGPLFDRFPRRPLFTGSTLLAGVALIGVEPGMPFTRWLLHAALFGLGIGLYDTLINAVVVQRYGERAARPMIVLHAAATLGAVLAPLGAEWIAARAHYTASFVWVGWAHVAVSAWALCVPLPAPPQAGPAGPARQRALDFAPLLPLAAVAFCYVGVEAAATVFAVPYATGGLGLAAHRGQLGISAFWLGLLAGRLGVLALRGELAERVLVVAGLAAAAVLAAGAGLALGPLELLLGVFGLALGSVYPVMIALAGQSVPDARGTAAGLAAGAGALGGFFVPWLTGALGDALGVRLGFASLALWCAAMAAAAWVAARATSRSRLGSMP